MSSSKRKQKSDDFLALPIPWEELDVYLKKDNIKEYARNIDISTFILGAESKNREAIIASALKSLKKTDPENATRKRAELLADRMQKFAQGIVSKTKIKSSKKG